MRTLFSIESERKSGERHQLLLELGQNYCCYGFFEDQSQSFNLIRYIAFDDMEENGRLAEVLEELKIERFKKVVVCSSFLQALLIPQKFRAVDEELIDVVYDIPGQMRMADAIPEWQMVNSYLFPRDLHQQLSTQFSSLQFVHVYTSFLKAFQQLEYDHLAIHFTTHHFRVMLKKENKISLAETYAYKVPLDVIYYLLKVFYEFQLSQSDFPLVISGLIQSDSALFAGLKNYFLNVSFAEFPPYSIPVSEHPHYFFNSLYNLAACAS